jgi:hypothetical protein
MDIPKITLPSPSSLAPNLSLQSTIKNIGSSGTLSIPAISAPNLGDLGSGASKALGNFGGGSMLPGGTSALGGIGEKATGALGGIGEKATGALGGIGEKATGALGGLEAGKDAITSRMETLTGPARAKFMSSVSSFPDPAPGLKGIMEKGVDLGTFQEKSLGNLMSKVSDFSPGKSILELSKEADIANSLKDKLNSLKPSLPSLPSLPGVPSGLGAVAQQALTGGAIGAVAGAITGGTDKLGGALKGGAIGAGVGVIGGAISNSAGGITSKLGSALGGGAVADVVSKGIAGAAGGAALAKLTGQSVNLKSAAGNLAGSIGGGLGAQLGTKLTGANIPGASGLGAAAGGLISGMVGGSAGKKALTGLAAGAGITALTGALTKNLKAPDVKIPGAGEVGQSLSQQVSNTTGQLQAQAIGTGPSQPLSGPSNALSALPISNVTPSQPLSGPSNALSALPISNVTSTKPPDLSKSAPLDIISLGNKSPQSVPDTRAPIPADSNNTTPGKNQIEAVLSGRESTTTVTSASFQETAEAFVGATDVTNQAGVSDFVATKAFIRDMSGVIRDRYKGFLRDDTWSSMVIKMADDMKKVTDEDKNRVQQVIKNYNGAFSIGFSSAVSDPKGVSEPQNRKLSFNDYLALDTKNFYQFITGVAEGSHVVKPIVLPSSGLSNSTPYQVFISQKSPSEVLLTVSHPAFGSATGIIPRIEPPPLETLFDAHGVYTCGFKYHYATSDIPENKWPKGVPLDTLNPNGGAMFRMWAQFGKPKRYCCGGDIVIGDMNCGKATGEKPYEWENIFPIPWPYGAISKLKISDTLYYMVTYHAYTINIDSIQVYKLVPKK